MKNDITYEYRVFTSRPVDIESMEVGRCTSKIIKELKSKDKVDGRFFHTSDTDEWFFCWGGELQKLNLKGDSDVSAALDEVKVLIANANAAVDEAKKTAKDAEAAADKAQAAADAAGEVIDSIENKADKSDVEAVMTEIAGVSEVATAAKDVADAANAAIESVSKVVETKVDASVVEALEGVVNGIKVPTKVSELENDKNYLTDHQDITGKQDVIADLDDIRAKANAALDSIPDEYVTEDELSKKGYLTVDAADLKYAPIGGNGVDLSDYATKKFVGEEIGKLNIPTKVSELENDKNYLTEHQDITGKQDVIADLEEIRTKAKGALQSIPDNYVTEDELTTKGYLTASSLDGYATEEFVSGEISKIEGVKVPTKVSELENDSNYITNSALNDYFTKDEIRNMIGDAIAKTNTILDLEEE